MSLLSPNLPSLTQKQTKKQPRLTRAATVPLANLKFVHSIRIRHRHKNATARNSIKKIHSNYFTPFSHGSSSR